MRTRCPGVKLTYQPVYQGLDEVRLIRKSCTPPVDSMLVMADYRMYLMKSDCRTPKLEDTQGTQYRD